MKTTNNVKSKTLLLLGATIKSSDRAEFLYFYESMNRLASYIHIII